MAADRSIAELERFLAERADHLLHTAVLLTGSREAGEDLLQTAVERLLRRWRRSVTYSPSGHPVYDESVSSSSVYTVVSYPNRAWARQMWPAASVSTGSRPSS